MKNYRAAITDWKNMISESWTWEKLTEEERNKFLELVTENEPYIKGNYEERQEILGMIYNAFLCGLGYTGMHWRVDGCSVIEQFRKKYFQEVKI